MIEVAFSQSACGSLRMAQRYGIGNYTEAPLSLWQMARLPPKKSWKQHREKQTHEHGVNGKMRFLLAEIREMFFASM